MKATDLMIGDWVKVTDDDSDEWFFGIVCGIDRDNVLVVEPGYSVGYPYAEECIEPVPLTPETLEKNGFVFDKNRKAYLMGLIFQLRQRFDGSFYLNGVQCLSIGAVHELQHALKLCGVSKEIVI